jgi:hypothetical protein
MARVHKVMAEANEAARGRGDKSLLKRVCKALNDAVDGMEGYAQELGMLSPYWSDEILRTAKAVLNEVGYKRHNPNDKDPN